MTVRVWHSFSCNNSSEYRLIARFERAARAAEVHAELRRALDLPQDESIDRLLGDPAGFLWDDPRGYGEDTDPQAGAVGEVLALYHPYALGWPRELKPWLEVRGATVEAPTFRPPTVSVMFHLPTRGDSLGLAERFAARGEGPKRRAVDLPWTSRQGSANRLTRDEPTGFFCDGETLALHAPIEPRELPALQQWLAEHGVQRPTIRLCEYGDAEKFDAMARARCGACGGEFVYVEPQRHGLDVEQLACRACGAMYELTVALAQAARPAPSSEKP
jgi:hypothetical protein